MTDRHEAPAVEILRALGSRPAAPFFEDGPAEYILARLDHLGVSVAHDAFGNIIAHFTRSPERDQPPLAFVAHMDHPGFEIVEATEDRVVARALGGVPVASLRKPTPVLVLTPDGRRLAAEVGPPDERAGRDESDRLVMVRLESPTALTPPVPVVFDLPDFVLDGDTIRMRAVDDLAGCASILAALERLVADGAETDLYAVFTRAEEGGLFGARLMAEAGTLPKDTLVVSVEASPVIPGVAQGEGPVIRTGDAAYTFDADAEQVLNVAADRIGARDRGFRHQRRLMSGGGCEATAFALFGYRVTGLAFPLGNHHNATAGIGDPDGGVDAEYIRLSDYLGGVELIVEAAKSVSRRGDSPVRSRLRSVPDQVRRRLEATAHA